MASTTVVSGRVALGTSRRVDAILKKNHTTAAEVIKTVWENIEYSGELPESFVESEYYKRKMREKRQNLDEFFEWCDSIEWPESLVNMTNEEMRDILGSRDV